MTGGPQRLTGLLKMELAKAEPSDLPAIVALMNLAFRGLGATTSWNSEASYIEGERTNHALLESEIASSPDASLLVHRAFENGSILGSVWLEPIGSNVWYLGSLTVDPSFQNGGMGRRMLAAAEEWVGARGASTVTMTVVNVRHELIQWYERRGYSLTGETKPFPYDDYRYGVPQRHDLEFVVLDKLLNSA